MWSEILNIRSQQLSTSDKFPSVLIYIGHFSCFSNNVAECFRLQTDSEINQLGETLQRLNDKLEALREQYEEEEIKGTNYRMRHIKELSKNKTYKMLGMTGLKLKV